MSAPVLWWVRRDLRLDDNPALAWAAARGPVLPVFVWSPEEEGASAPGAASRWWLERSLEALARTLASRGLPLIIRRGPAAQELAALARESGARAAAWGRVWEPATRAQQDGVAAALRAAGLETAEQPANLLFEPDRIRSLDGRPYRVFTPFWARCAQEAAPPAPAPAPRSLRAVATRARSLKLPELSLSPRHRWTRKLAETWTPGEDAARKDLRAFLEGRVDSYGTQRDFPDRDGTSRLSPRLHFGELSVRRVWAEAMPYRQNPGAKGGFLSELGWREFAAHVLAHFPETVERPLDKRFHGFGWLRDEAGLEAWRRGRTGFSLVDAGMRQLWATGWMHNRVRMVVASFLTKDLLVDWREGAAWFRDTLVDYDLAANTLGWQWAAGCGADAAPFFRIFNPEEQAKRWDASGAYRRRWAPTPPPASIVDHAAARRRALDAFGRRQA